MSDIESLLLFEEEEVGKNRESIKNKTRSALFKASINKISTRGIENIAPYYLAKKGLFQQYYEMVGSIKIDGYSTYSNLREQDIHANMFFLWRAYTFLKEAQILNLYNFPRRKNKATSNLFSGLTNCSKASVDRIIGELAKRGPRHPQLFQKEYVPHAEKDIGASEVYNLTARADEFIFAFERRLTKMNYEFIEVSLHYTDFLIDVIANLINYKIITYHNISGEKKQGEVLYHYLTIRGEQALSDAKEIHNANYEYALSTLPLEKALIKSIAL